MALLSIKNVTLAYGGHPLLEGAELHLEKGEKVCLVGRNGVGKTTLFRILAGEVIPDDGEIVSAGARVAVLPQQVPDDIEGTCLDVVLSKMASRMDDPEIVAKGHSLLSRMGLEPDAGVDTLSGGMKRRVLLARAIIGEPDLLLLDEPTNHLDIPSIEWVEGFLERYRGAICFISHDRQFIRRLATRVVELDRGRLTSWPGDYDNYTRRKEASLAAEAKANEKFDKLLAAEESWIRQGIQARRTRNEGRVRRLQALRDTVRGRRHQVGRASIQIRTGQRTSKKVVALEAATFSYDAGSSLLSDMTFTVYRNDKIGIIGPNGCGKTTLLKLLLGELTPTGGSVQTGDGLQVAYLDQLRQSLDETRTVAENVVPDGDKVVIDGVSKHVIPYLGDFLFTPDRARSPLWVLSGGERNRLLLARLFTRPANVLVLDEPTNDLDAETLELLEDRIVAFSGTVLIVSHDRAFLNNTVSSTLVFEEGTVRDYPGGYDDWLAQRPAPATSPSITQDAPSRAAPHAPRKGGRTRKLTYRETRELERLPDDIEALETEKGQLMERVNDPQFYRDYPMDVITVSERLADIDGLLDSALERWALLESIQEG